MRKIVFFVLTALFVMSFGSFATAQDDMGMMEIEGAVVLDAVDGDGVPEDIEMDMEWLDAWGFTVVSTNENGEAIMTLYADNLVPEGLYTMWWVNNMGNPITMNLGPAGGLPNNEFTATETGAAEVTITLPADYDYETLVVAYHADGMTHGEVPGEMGSQTFSHLMSAFPSANTTPETLSVLQATDGDGVPENIEMDMEWLDASAVAQVTEGDMGIEVTVYMTDLVPEGLYTMWWVNNMGNPITMSLGPAGGLPNNEFTADADGTAAVTITVEEDYDYETLVIAYHADGMTHGEVPGEMGSQTFSHLMGAFPQQ